MWTFFSRKSHRKSHNIARQALAAGSKPRIAGTRHPAWAPITANPIATIDQFGPTAVATLTVAALARSEGVAQLMGLFEAVSRSGARHFVLDIQNLEYMDSACLGCLVKALNHATADGGRIALANADVGIQGLFRTTSLDRRFPICHDVPSALAQVERGALGR
jgi:anti-anti-sigma factor